MATKSNSLVMSGRASTAHLGPLSEAQLVAAAKEGHQAAFGELCTRHEKKIYRSTLRITRNHEDAEDAVQDSFLSAYVHLQGFDGRSTFSTWLTRIAINSALMKLRKNRGCPEVSMDEPADPDQEFMRYEPVDPQPNPEQRFSHRQREQIVTGAVRKLRPQLRQVIEMRRLHEYSTRETARTLRISIAAAKSRLFHARVALRQIPSLRAIARHRVRRAA